MFYILKQSGYGCYIGNNFTGSFGYADDIILLSLTVTGMQQMLDICNNYANQHQILFNASKSCSVIFASKDCKHVPTHSICVFRLNGQQIPIQDNAKHLGHTIIGKLSGDIDIECIIKSFNRSVKILLAEFGAVPSTILCRLFQSYCTSLYGIVLCKYSSCEFARLCVAWRKAVRRILRIPRYSHNKFIPLLSGMPPIECMLKSRIFRFFTSLIKNENVLCKTLAQRCLYQRYG